MMKEILLTRIDREKRRCILHVAPQIFLSTLIHFSTMIDKNDNADDADADNCAADGDDISDDDDDDYDVFDDDIFPQFSILSTISLFATAAVMAVGHHLCHHHHHN